MTHLDAATPLANGPCPGPGGTRRPRPGVGRLIAMGYAAYMLAGAVLLALPAAGAPDTAWLDHLFIAVSAVSTTGLVTVDPGATYSRFGQAVILLLIQAGGVGFMTANSVVWMVLTDRGPPALQRQVARSVFALPARVPPRIFLGRVVVYTVIVEAIGTGVLGLLFDRAGVAAPLWQGLFHGVSAFCTAGFSLFASSFEEFAGDLPVLATISVLSVLGALGFLLAHEVWDRLRGRSAGLSVSSRLILKVNAVMLAGGTLVLAVAEPQLAARDWPQRLANAFFQAMTASTTVGFNSIPLAPYAHVAVMTTYVLKLVGASPSGTGGGLKITTVAVQWAFMWAVLRGRTRVTVAGATVPEVKVRQAVATFFMAAALLAAAMFALSLSEPGTGFEALLFEAISALGTVGLSLGITGGLSAAGQAVIILLMYAGRVGILAFGLLLVARATTPHPELPPEDVAL